MMSVSLGELEHNTKEVLESVLVDKIPVNIELEKGLLPKPTLARDPIQVYCSCKSYRFRADFANRRRHAGTGPHFPPYHRISDRAPYNPRNIACFCKHVIEFVDYLKKQGFVH